MHNLPRLRSVPPRNGDLRHERSKATVTVHCKLPLYALWLYIQSENHRAFLYLHVAFI